MTLMEQVHEIYFEDNKKYTKFIKDLGKTVRSSIEYKYWAEVKKGAQESCVKCGQHKLEGAKLNVHHEPLTLFEIIDAVVKQRFIKKDDSGRIELKGKPMDIVNEIVRMHVDNEIGYMVLCECCHTKLHANRKVNGKSSDKFYIYDNEV